MTSQAAVQSGAALHPDLEKSASRKSDKNVPPEELLAGEADAELLGKSMNLANWLMLTFESETRLQARTASQFYDD